MGRHPFVDIAVLEPIRRAFAAGDALVVAEPDLSRVIWAEGAGLGLFGLGSLDAALDGEAAFDDIQKRQIAAALPERGAIGMLHMRFVSGAQTILLPVHLSLIDLPRGDTGLLLRVPAHAMRERLATEGTVAAIGRAGSHAAFIRPGADILTSSAGFGSLGIDEADLSRMLQDARRETDRLVKRPIRTSRGILPAALARLTDEDNLHLLLVVDPEGIFPAEESDPVEIAQYAPDMTDEPAHQAAPDMTDEPAHQAAPDMTDEPAHQAAQIGDSARDDGVNYDADDADDVEDSAEAAAQFRDAIEMTEDQAEDEPADGDEVPGGEPAAPSAATPNPATLRFAWKADADGRITEISSAFTEMLGFDAQTLLGRTFGDVAPASAAEEVRALAELMARAATWSGRDLPWASSDGETAIPASLSGLPLFGRDRLFEGYRGFGIARPDDRISIAPAKDQPVESAAPAARDPAVVIPFGRRGGAAAGERHEGDDISGAAVPPPALNADEQAALEEIRNRLGATRSAAPEALEAPETLEAPEAALPEDDAGESDEAAEAAAQMPDADRDDPDEADDAAFDAVPESTAAMFSKLPLAVLVYANERLLFANDMFLDLAGYPSLAAIGAAGGLDALFGTLENAGADDEAAGMRLRTANGSDVNVNAHLQSVPWGDGKALMLAVAPKRRQNGAEGAVSAVPEQSADAPPADAALAQIEELTAILNTATDGVVVLAEDGRIKSMNSSAEALFGRDQAEVAGSHFNTLLAIESHKTARDYLEGLTGHGVASVLNDGREMIGREREGRFIPIFVTIGRLSASSGFCAVIRDMSNWKTTEQELSAARRQAEAASLNKTEFLARISHEIRTPLNAIIGFAELMLNERFGPVGNERYRGYVGDIQRSGQLVLDLVNDLLDISKIEAGALQQDFAAVDLDSAAGEAASLLAPQAARSRVLLRTAFDHDVPQVVADPRSIRQIILNLVGNSVRHTAPGGQVIVSTAYERDGSVALRVRDTGSGMSPGELDLAMKPYGQVRSSDGAREGTGLGLPLARALTESNKAEFRIRSTPGEGTTVEILFPPSRVLAG
jgi:PAS domain S-box-containing protein